MAVIQDLPPELLRRILELLASDSAPQRDLHSTCLVAHAWTSPSQQLLLYTSGLSQVIRYLKQHTTGPLPHSRVKALAVTNQHAAELQMLGKAELLVEELDVGLDFAAGNELQQTLAPVSVPRHLISTIRTLSLSALITLDDAGDAASLAFALKELTICSWCTPAPNLLQPLAALTVNVSELSLLHGGGAFPSYANGPFAQIGPRLVSLKL